MYIKSVADLIYVSQGKSENGSPIELKIIKGNMRVDETETFSNRYYSDEQRNMRLCRNLVVPTYYTEDIVKDDKTYELLYVDYQNKSYKVRNILKVKATRSKMILDIQEL